MGRNAGGYREPTALLYLEAAVLDDLIGALAFALTFDRCKGFRQDVNRWRGVTTDHRARIAQRGV